MICKHCSVIIESDYWQTIEDSSWFSQLPVFCSVCHKITWVDQEQHTDNKLDQSDRVPELEIGSQVIVRNKEHDRFNRLGFIADKSHLHYRILFDDDTTIWMPYHWIRAI